ncbi:MAG: hypothetical protein RLY97_1693 [Pseudomonadota bacterium]|jgi:hypothetical protein
MFQQRVLAIAGDGLLRFARNDDVVKFVKFIGMNLRHYAASSCLRVKYFPFYPLLRASA